MNSIVMPQARHVQPSRLDVAALRTAMRADVQLRAEQLDGDADAFLDLVIAKPWGHEYRVYADSFYDIWRLCLLPGQSTSTHCHPRKETALLCLSGTGRMRVLDRTYPISASDIVYIRKGAFHSTVNDGGTALDLIEVEVPRNKLDLIRSGDHYGRTGASYETTTLDAHASHITSSVLVPGSKLRADCILGRYRFGLTTGGNLRHEPRPDLLFAVSVDILKALRQEIQVIPHHAVSEEAVEDDIYFVIQRTA